MSVCVCLCEWFLGASGFVEACVFVYVCVQVCIFVCFNTSHGLQQNGTAEANLFNDGSNSVGQGQGQEEKKSTKDSIMALYGSAGGGQPQVFGVPGTELPSLISLSSPALPLIYTS